MTRRVKFIKTTITGNEPSSLPSGTPAFNLADGKVFVGNTSDQPQLMSQKIEDFTTVRIYRAGDFAIRSLSLYRAIVDVPAGLAFNPDQWEQISDPNDAAGVPTRTASITGGEVSISGTTTVSIAAGSGIVSDLSTPGDPTITVVEWGAFSATVPSATTPPASFFIAIDAGGNFVSGTQATYTTRKSAIVLAVGLKDVDTGTLSQIWDSRQFVSRTSDEVTSLMAPSLFRGMKVSGATGTTGLSVLSGVLRGLGVGEPSSPNFLSIPGGSPITFSAISFRRTSDYQNITDVPTGVYDNLAAVVPLTGSQATIHMLVINKQGEYFLEIGQIAYTSLSEAVAALGDYEASQYQAGGRIPVIGSADTAVVGAVIVRNGATDLTDPLQAVIVPRQADVSAFPFSGGDQDLANYYLLDGSRPLAGDMDMSGFGLLNGKVDGADGTSILPTNSAGTGDVPTGGSPNEIQTNRTDRKVFQSDGAAYSTIADRIEVHDAARAYREGDACYQTNVLYKCKADIPAKAFDAADWDEIGTSAPANAVVTNPTVAGRNTVDLTGSPSVEGLVITPDASQTSSIADIGGAVVDQYGLPSGNFGNVIFRVNQAGIGDAGIGGLSSVGRAAAFDGANWAAADASDLTSSGKAVASVMRVIDANAVDLQVAGGIVDLSTSSFVGGVAPTAGQVYYVSSVNAGLLTATAPAAPNRIDPVLVATSPSQGVLTLAAGGDVTLQGGGQTFFEVSQAAHGFTEVGTPIYLDTDGIWKAARADVATTLGRAVVQEVLTVNSFTANTAGFLNSVSANAFEGDVAPSVPGTVYYVSQTDAGRLSPSVPSGTELRNPLYMAIDATTGVVLPYEPEEQAVLRSGDSMVGDLTLTSGAKIRIDDDDPSIIFNNLPEVPDRSKWRLSSTDLRFEVIPLLGDESPRSGGMLFDASTTSLTDVRLTGVGAALPTGNSLLTGNRGDARYLALAGGTVTGATTFDDLVTLSGGGTVDGGLDLTGATSNQQLRLKDDDYAAGSSNFGQTSTGTVALTTGDNAVTEGINYVFGISGAATAATVMRREDTDNRHPRLAASNTFTGGLNNFANNVDVGGNLVVSGGITGVAGDFSGQVTINTGTSAFINMGPNADFGLSAFQNGPTEMALGVVANGTTVYRFDEDGLLGNPENVATRGNGDARWARLAGANSFTSPQTLGGGLSVTGGTTLLQTTVALEGAVTGTLASITLQGGTGSALAVGQGSAIEGTVRVQKVSNTEASFASYNASGDASIHGLDASGVYQFAFFDDSGASVGVSAEIQQDGAAAPATSTTLMTRQMSDDRHPRLTAANTLTGDNALTGANTLKIAGGAAATPSIAFNGDPNTGIYQTSPDTLSIATNGAEAFRARGDQGIELFGDLNFSDGSAQSGAGIGYGQTLQDFSGIREGGVTYQNTTGRPIQVIVEATGGGQFQLSNDGVTFWNVCQLGESGSFRTCVSAIVPDGAYYKTTGSGFSYKWTELR